MCVNGVCQGASNASFCNMNAFEIKLANNLRKKQLHDQQLNVQGEGSRNENLWDIRDVTDFDVEDFDVIDFDVEDEDYTEEEILEKFETFVKGHGEVKTNAKRVDIILLDLLRLIQRNDSERDEQDRIETKKSMEEFLERDKALKAPFKLLLQDFFEGDEYIESFSTPIVKSSSGRNECLFQDILLFREIIQRACEGLSRLEINNVVLTCVLMIAVGLSDDCSNRVVCLLHKKGADISYRFKGGEFVGKTLLHFPIEDPYILKYLLEQKVSPDLKDKDGNTALHCAAQRCDLENMKILLAHDADPTICNDAGKTPRNILEAHKDKVESESGLEEYRKTIIELRKKEYVGQQQKDKDGNTALHCAAQRRDFENMKMLLDYGADPTICNDAGKTPRNILEAYKVKIVNEFGSGLEDLIEIITELHRKEYARQQQAENEKLRSLGLDTL
jgi:hypothetical protein